MSGLSAKQKSFLKSKAHHLKPSALVGKKGVTSEFLKSVSQLLNRHELVKIKFNDFKDDRRALFVSLANTLEGEAIGMVGNTGILFKQNPKIHETRYPLP